MGLRNMMRAGYSWAVFAYFPCNAGGVRVAIRKTPAGAERFAVLFSKRNKVECWTKLRWSANDVAKGSTRSRGVQARGGVRPER